jgi:hypothetical protein
MIKTLQEERD